MQLLIINGPNLNLLGHREPDIYGTQTFEDVLLRIRQKYPSYKIGYFQSNHEGELVDRVQTTLAEELDGVVLNLGALTHYSYALHDALKMVKCPKVEVHISHIFSREAFRHQSVIAPACDGMISGLGTAGYDLAIQWLAAKGQ
ncbi:type II 3-dehydroquinate dehydratase [Pontibacter sp. G13]|uniref:type II 3-dehydroquinate dehydratase n=1 Tax=Pontibacter sp. G13 TaxID=3074898 RepID=UPI00288AA543|nr:type II 3-dehydroquinate dehydratase [Pontibacter sp. G13]WNJ16301.1 type II 3-dehydroquinate dehydratase [Pontibacter sp. G13]